MAFPLYTHSTVDDFNRANESPLSQSGAWTAWSGGWPQQGAVVSNQCTGAANDFWSSLRVTTQGDFELILDLPTLGAVNERYLYVYSRLESSPTVATLDGYEFNVSDAAGTSAFLNEYVNGTATQLATASVTWAAADKIGIQCIGTGLELWRHNGTSWANVFATTDATRTTGHWAIGGYGNVVRLDNITIGTTTAAAAHSLSLLGVG